MKKILILLMFIFVLTGCTTNNIKSINYQDLNNKMDNKETFILLIKENNCDNCDLLKTTLNNILNDYNLQAYSINTSKLSTTETDTLKLKIDYEMPSIVFIKNGIDPTYLTHINTHLATSSDIIERLKDFEFIKD